MKALNAVPPPKRAPGLSRGSPRLCRKPPRCLGGTIIGTGSRFRAALLVRGVGEKRGHLLMVGRVGLPPLITPNVGKTLRLVVLCKVLSRGRPNLPRNARRVVVSGVYKITAGFYTFLGKMPLS